MDGGRIRGRYHSLTNAVVSVPPFILFLTGISTAMLRKAPPVAEVMAARRIYPEEPNHNLGTLIQFTGLPAPATYQRALTDAEMAAALLNQMKRDLQRPFGLNLDRS